MKKFEWTTEWPTSAGLYWFCGWPYGKDEDHLASLSMVRAVVNGGGTITCIREGHFFYESEGATGQFSPVELPELPTLA